MKKRILAFLLALTGLLYLNEATAQELGGFSTIDKYQQRARIGLVGEFMKRFNGQEFHPDIPASVRDSRKKNLMMLYNLNMFKSQRDKKFKDASSMMDVVISKNTKIHYQDSAWCAKALCSGTLNGKNVSFYLYLTVKPRGGRMYEWVIAKAEGKIFSSKTTRTDKTASKSKKGIMLFPDDHETNFMSLSRIVNSYSRDIEKIVRKDYTDGQTASFVYLVYNQKLKLNYVSKLEFIFEQVPGYEFTVAYFQKGKSNLGWLISSFRKISSTTKNDFLSSLYKKREDTLVAKPTDVTKSEIVKSTSYIDIADSIAETSEDSIEGSSSILSETTVKALHQSDSVVCLLLDPMSKDTTKIPEGRYEVYEVLNSTLLDDAAANALKTTLLYPESFVKKNYVKDCTFLPDVAFVFYSKGTKRMILTYSFYCDVCGINSDGKPSLYDGELIRDSILQISLEAFPNDRYMRRIAGKTR